jgi:hypothetical protein
MTIKDAAKEHAQRHIGEHPFLFHCFYGLRPGYRGLLVDRTTRLVIEGFPRSGNTFAVVAFQQAQPEAFRIAHHLHMPAQVMLAARWRIPTLILIRKPTDAVLSWTIREPRISVRRAMTHYIWFHEKIAEYRHEFVVGLFEEVTQDYGAVLERVNARFGTRFSSFEHSKENVKSAFAHIEKVHRARRNRLNEKQIARPSAVKAEMKDVLRRGLETPEVRKLTNCAEVLYRDLALP